VRALQLNRHAGTLLHSPNESSFSSSVSHQKNKTQAMPAAAAVEQHPLSVPRQRHAQSCAKSRVRTWVFLVDVRFFMPYQTYFEQNFLVHFTPNSREIDTGDINEVSPVACKSTSRHSALHITSNTKRSSRSMRHSGLYAMTMVFLCAKSTIYL
jgi:hypothetical protein